MVQRRPLMLTILDGWGYSKAKEGNAVLAARTPNLDRLEKEYPWCFLEASGVAVGLPEGMMGNSEVGHLTIGAGRIVYQDLTRINISIKNGDFFKNPVFLNAISNVKANDSSLHLTYDLKPEMSAYKITDEVIRRISQESMMLLSLTLQI
jgi:2,3-bisphosphoglycerate-independent phosphoglycerate mutase